MTRNYKFIDHTADIALMLEGDTLHELFIAGFEAWLASVAEINDYNSGDHLKVEISASSKEQLLVSFLNELNFHLITKKWLCLNVDSIKINESSEEFNLVADLKGIKVDNDFELKEEIKSVTYHQMEIIKKKNIYSTLVVFDI